MRVLAAVALFAALFTIAAANDYDQFTDVSGAVRNMPRGQLWQSFTAGRSGELKAVDILMGVRYPCESLKGRITVRHGVPSTDGAEGSMGASTVLLSQDAMTTCPDSIEALQGACANGDCLRWQEFELSESLSLTKGEVYSFVLEGFYSADMTRTARVGVSPFSENNGGHSSLVVSPVYKTKYTQYTFRTRMDASQDKGVELEEENPSSGPGGSSGSASSSSSIGASGIAVIAVVVALVVVLAAVVVRQRKNMQQRKISFGSSQSLNSASSDDGLMKTTRRRHPIQVRSQDMDAFAGNTWAQSVNTSLQSLPEEDESAFDKRSRHSSIAIDEDEVSRTLSLDDYRTEAGPLFGSVDV